MTAPKLDFISLNHLNAVVDGYDAAFAAFCDVLGAQPLFHNDPDGDLQTGLLAFGPVIYEFFGPGARQRGYGKLLAQYGPYFHGIEFRVPNLPEAKKVLANAGIRLLLDREFPDHPEGSFILTHPKDFGGVALELFEGDWCGEPPPSPFEKPLFRQPYWSEAHPLGILGLDRICHRVPDVEYAAAAWSDLVHGALDRVVAGDDGNRRTEHLRFSCGGVAVDLVPMPEGATPAGPIQPGIETVTYRVRSLDQVTSWFDAQGIGYAASGPSAVSPDDARTAGLRFEFHQ